MMKMNKFIDINATLLDAFQNTKNHKVNDTFNYNMCVSRNEYEIKKQNEQKQNEIELLNYYKQFDEANKTNKYHEYKKQLYEYKSQKQTEKTKSKVERIIQILLE